MGQTTANTITDANAVAFFHSARKFHEAANQLFDLQKPSVSDPCDPIKFLYFHTVELALKAFLRSHNVSILGTERKSHKLTELYGECRSLGLTIGPADRFEIGNIVTLLEGGNKYQGFRYPNLESGSMANLSWTREVVEHLMRAIGPHVEACSKRDPTPGTPVGFRVIMTIGKPGQYAVMPATKGSAKK
jgi:hypothetical protein